MKIGPGDFVVATRSNGTRIYGFVERIIDDTTKKAVLPRAPRRPNDRFVIRSLLGRTMTPFADETGIITSDADPRSEKAVLETPEPEVFKKESIKLLSVLPPDDVNENNVAEDDSDFKFPGSFHEKQALVSLHKRLKDDHAFESCSICGEVGLLMMCETCVASAHLHCQAPPLPRVPDYEWRCHKCNAKPSPLFCAVRFRHLMRRMILEICELDQEGHFGHPVSIWFVVPTYAEKIPYPVDLSMMLQKAERSCYKSVIEVIEDLDTMIENCKKFNEGTPLADYASEFHRKATDLIQKYRAQLRQEDVSEIISNELMGLVAGFSSESQVKSVDSLSVSVFGSRALPLTVRNCKGNLGTTGNSNRPAEPVTFPMVKASSVLISGVEHHQAGGGGGVAAVHQNLRRQQLANGGGARRNQNHQNAATRKSDYAEEKALLTKALQLPEHVAKDPNFSFPHPIRVTFCTPACFQGKLQVIYTTDGSHPAKSSTSKLYDGKPILLSPPCVQATKEDVDRILNRFSSASTATNKENSANDDDDTDQIREQRDNNNHNNNISLSDKITIKSICTLPHEMIDPTKEDDRTRSSVSSVTYKFASPHINYVQAMTIQQQQQQQSTEQQQVQQSSRNSILRNSNHQRRSCTNSTESELTKDYINSQERQQQSQQRQQLPLSAGKRRGRTVKFQGDEREEKNSGAIIEMIGGILPSCWIHKEWIELFLEKTKGLETFTDQELEVYQVVMMNSLPSDSSGGEALIHHHEDDKKRVLRDYLLFITINMDLVELGCQNQEE